MLENVFTKYFLLGQQTDLTVCSSIGFKQTEAIVSTLWTVGKAFEHAEIRNVEGGGQKISHLTHKL